MMKKFILTFFLLVSSVSMANGQKKYLVAYNETTAPLVPLVKAIYREIGINPEFILVPSERSIHDTDSGSYDADLARSKGTLEKYPNVISSNEPLKKTELFAYVKKGSSIGIKNISDLKRYTVGVVLGAKLPEKFAAEEGLKVELAASVSSFNLMFEVGRFDIALITDTQLLSQLKHTKKEGVRIGPILRTTYSFHVFNKKNKELIPAFDSALKAMKLDGRFNKLSPLLN